MPLSIQYVKIGDITKMLGVSRSTIYKWVETDVFPKPVHFGNADKNSTVRWIQDEIEEWLANRPREKVSN